MRLPQSLPNGTGTAFIGFIARDDSGNVCGFFLSLTDDVQWEKVEDILR